MKNNQIPSPFVGAGIVSIFVLAVFGTILIVEHRFVVNEARSDARLQIEIHRRQIEAILDRVETDVTAVLRSPAIQEYAADVGDTESRERAGDVLHSFASAKRIYDQIRLISENGQELIRVNRTDSGAVIVPTSDLQDKSNRYYVTEGLLTEPHGWYVSPFDLNVEGGVIETPRNPMIRLVRPIDIDGERRGIVVLNYRGEELFSSLRQTSASSSVEIGLANADGWWLYVDDPEREWQFMFPESAAGQPNAFRELGDLAGKVFSENEFLFAERAEIIASTAIVPFRNVVEANSVRRWYLVYRADERDLGIDVASQARSLIVPFAITLLLGGGGGFVLFRSLRQRNEYRGRLERAAFIDELTQLPNRRYLYDQLNRSCEIVSRYGQSFVVLFIDIDGFKPVNDRFGHDAGDEVLVEIAHRLQSVVRTSDLVARLGGDEFVISANSIAIRDDAETVAQKILTVLSRSITLSSGNSVDIGASIGIFGVFDQEEITRETISADSIVRFADAGMYEAKRAGKNRFAWAAGKKT